MFRHDTPDQGQDLAKVEEVEAAHRLAGRGGELQHHEPRAGPEHACGLAQAAVEVHQVADPEADGGAIELGVGERQFQGIGVERGDPFRLAPATNQHREDEIGPNHRALESLPGGQFGRQVQGSRAEVQVAASGRSVPPQLVHRPAAPPLVDVETQQVVEQVVAWRDIGEDLAHVGPLLAPAGER